MNKFLITAAVLLASTLFISAQTLYMPKNVQRAYKNDTRSSDGKPGKKYWQNKAVYDITINVSPPDRFIKGSEEITYFNNSNDTLKQLNLKLFMNLHRPGAARSVPASFDYLTSGMQIDNISVNGSAVRRRPNDFTLTNERVPLSKALLPHDSVRLSITWKYELSVESNREGAIDETSFYLAYFYPRVAVYDDYYGWDTITYTDLFEFYNDFSDYTLKVITPKNFIVWATGTLENANEVLQPVPSKRLQSSFTSDSVIHIATASEITSGTVTVQKDFNTWKWKAKNISDMAIGISDHYVWDASSVIVDPKTNRRASMQAAYASTSKYFSNSVADGRKSLAFLSTQWPGIPYPYPKMTTFQGFADMEYPMMVNDSDTDDREFGRFVQDHEIAHTYFPFYMGINESRYASMDEGWATTFELLMSTAELGREKAEKNYKGFRVNGWSRSKIAEQDLPIMTPSNEVTIAYGNNAYGKPSLSYLGLKDMLGDDLFRKCLIGFMDRWNGKHPIPWDFFNSVNNITGKNFDWYFNAWFFSNGYIDIAIDNVSKSRDNYLVFVKNIGGMPVPFDAVVVYDDLTSETLHQTALVWNKNQKSYQLTIPGKKKVKTVKLEMGIFVDSDNNNNSWSN